MYTENTDHWVCRSSSSCVQCNVVWVCNYYGVGYKKKKNALAGSVEKDAEKGISLALTWMGELLEECLVAHGKTVGGWFTAFFHAVYVVVECSRVPPLLPPPTEPTTTSIIIIIINQHQHHNSKRGNDGFLSHSVSRWRFLFRREAAILYAFNQPGNVHSRIRIVTEQHRRPFDVAVVITVPSGRLGSCHVDCSTRRANNYLGGASDSSLIRSTLRDFAMEKQAGKERHNEA